MRSLGRSYQQLVLSVSIVTQEVRTGSSSRERGADGRLQHRGEQPQAHCAGGRLRQRDPSPRESPPRAVQQAACYGRGLFRLTLKPE